jgi:hypothetical protein
MDNFIYVLMKRVFVKNEKGLDLTFTSDYSDFTTFQNEEDAEHYLDVDLTNIEEVTGIPFVERKPTEIVGDNVEYWREWRQICFSKKEGVKIGIVLFKQKVTTL